MIKQRGIGNDLVVFKVPRIGVKFQISSPLLFPVLIQINDCVEPAMVPGRRVQVKINVRIHSLPRQIFVGASALIYRIIQQALDSSDVPHNLGELRRGNVVVNQAISRPDRTNIAAGKLSIFYSELIYHFVLPWNRKLGQHRLRDSWIEKLWNQDVAKRFRSFKLLAVRVSFVE